jgi:hypothetical protein
MEYYNYDKINLNNGFLDKSCSCTYIINFNNNNNIIISKLEKYQPTKIAYIVSKKYNKNENLSNMYIDIFLHAQKNNYNNILILEDEFIFSKRILNNNITNEINKFIINREGEEYVYLLGCLPFMKFHYKNNTDIVILSMVNHYASIYSKAMQERIIAYSKEIYDWNLYINFNFRLYMYNEPLCYQLYQESENYKILNIYGISYIIKKINSLLDLDNNVEPGYSYYYTFSKLSGYLLIIFILSVLMVLYFGPRESYQYINNIFRNL